MTKYYPHTMEDLKHMTATLWGEARGEPFDGKVAVAFAILNRVKAGGWYGKTVKEVCLKPFQFSCWNHGDKNYSQVHKILTSFDSEYGKSEVVRECMAACVVALNGVAHDDTQGATHYHTKRVSPAWSKDKFPVFVVGNHLFFNNID